MKFLVTLLALFAFVSAAFAKLNPADHPTESYRVNTCIVKLGDADKASAALDAVDEWVGACSPYELTGSGKLGATSARYWFVSNSDIMVGDCTYAKLASVASPGFKISACKEQPGEIDFTKCLQENTDELVCSYNVDSSACAQCKNNAVALSMVGVVAFLVVAMFF